MASSIVLLRSTGSQNLALTRKIRVLKLAFFDLEAETYRDTLKYALHLW